MTKSTCAAGLLAGTVAGAAGQAGFSPHSVRQVDGAGRETALAADFQIVTADWNRVVAVPYVVYMPEKQRLLMLVGCDYPHRAFILSSDDRGATWSAPRPVHADAEGKPDLPLATSLTYLGNGNVLLYAGSRWFSRDYGETWDEPVPVAPTPGGKPWYLWDPPLVERNPETGQVTRLIETGYTWFKPPEVEHAHQQAYIRFSADGGKTWNGAAKVPQWHRVSEAALCRAANGDIIAACRTDIPLRLEGEWLDHLEGLGISISTDVGRTWSTVAKLYDWGRHHPSLVLLPGGDILMTYVVRLGYVRSANGFPQFGIEAVVGRDNGRAWDLDHRYILHFWEGNRKESNEWWPSSQATSTVRLEDGTLLTAFGTGYRCREGADKLPTPRDVGLVRWRLGPAPPKHGGPITAAPFDSDLRNYFDPVTGMPATEPSGKH